MSRKPNLIGRVFERLTVINELQIRDKHGKVWWNCICQCGSQKTVETSKLIGGYVRSCGCLKVDTHKEIFVTHGDSKSVEYSIWLAIKKRCYDVSQNGYKDYGGRGIKVCERWINCYENFLMDMGRRPSKDYSIERKDNDKDYEPMNCKWAIRKEQNRNSRKCVIIEYKGEKRIMKEWAEVFGLGYVMFATNIRRGHSIDWILNFKNLKYIPIIKEPIIAHRFGYFY